LKLFTFIHFPIVLYKILGILFLFFLSSQTLWASKEQQKSDSLETVREERNGRIKPSQYAPFCHPEQSEGSHK